MIRRVYVPAPTPAWPFDDLGDVLAVITLFGMIALVGVASCWEVMQ
jgi:hypothetical protein